MLHIWEWFGTVVCSSFLAYAVTTFTCASPCPGLCVRTRSKSESNQVKVNQQGTSTVYARRRFYSGFRAGETQVNNTVEEKLQHSIAERWTAPKDDDAEMKQIRVMPKGNAVRERAQNCENCAYVRRSTYGYRCR